MSRISVRPVWPGFLVVMASAVYADCPFPEGIQHTSAIVGEAMQMYQQGVPAATLRQAALSFEQEKPWATEVMLAVVDEIYGFEPPIELDVYVPYRMEICYLKSEYDAQEEDFPFAEAYPLLQQCTAAEGRQKGICAMRTAQQISGIRTD